MRCAYVNVSRREHALISHVHEWTFFFCSFQLSFKSSLATHSLSRTSMKTQLWEQFEVQCRAQGHFNAWTTGAWVWNQLPWYHYSEHCSCGSVRGRIEKWEAEVRNRHAPRPVMDLYKWEVNGSCLWSTLGWGWTLALAPNSWWYLTVTLMTFSSDRQGLPLIPIRRPTPLQSAQEAEKDPQPQPLPANLGMNYWKGQSWAPPWRNMTLAERSDWHSSRTRGKGRVQHHVHLSYVSSGASLQILFSPTTSQWLL